MNIDLVGLKIQNIRGFDDTSIDLRAKRIILVGPNNSGKTSLMLILEWIFNGCRRDLLEGRVAPDPDTLATLIPARSTRNKARRVTARVYFRDGRTARRYEADDNRVADLRFRVVQSPSMAVYARVGVPRRHEAHETDPRAIELLRALQNRYRFVHIPSFRDVASDRFADTLTHLFREKLREKGLHSKRGGAPAEHRIIKQSLKALEDLASELTRPVWTQMKDSLPAGMVAKTRTVLDCSQEHFIDWLAEQLVLRLSTGTHDDKTVAPMAVGAGLQSLLDLAVVRSREEANGGSTILAIEEPEAFLHPSAQRVLARRVFSMTNIEKTVVTTHSSIMVEEARFSQLTVVQDHRFFQPEPMTNRRESICTYLLSGGGAEAMFSSSVMLVEGAGDRLYFEGLRRRLARVDSSGAIDRLFVKDVGGKQNFAPWIRMFNQFVLGWRGAPIPWVVVADSDATTDVMRALRDSGVTLFRDVREALQRISVSRSTNDIDQWVKDVRDANRILRGRLPVQFLPADLEFAILQAVSDDTIDNLRQELALDNCDNKEELMRQLGSRGVESPKSNGAMKAPYIRSLIGRSVPGNEVHSDVRRILELWASPVLSKRKMKDLFAEM